MRHLVRLRSFLSALALASFVIALQGCGAVGAQPNPPAAAALPMPSALRYDKHLPLWPENALRNPSRAAWIEAPAAGVRVTEVAALERLTIGLTDKEVTDAVGEPAARGEHGLRQYLVRSGTGAFAATVWLNEEGALWMGATDRAPLASLVTAPKEPIGAKRITLSAEELFAFDSDVLRLPQQQLDAIAAAARGRVVQPTPLVVKGYTDRLGNSAHNQSLALRRAQAVRTYLLRQGLDANQISAIGKGAADPVVACTGVKPKEALIACLAPNRRVVIERFSVEAASTH
ncbi:OmpA family protein [Variovorax humicola]|uniref:OmpA family protein n=1 Tax=Variovorax humicola TaxID=1769758 RepID=A0ABU8VYP4_9BURK